MNIASKISNFKIHGSYRPKKCKRLHNKANFLFDSLLPRLTFKLSNLVSTAILYEESHVFLGFTKNGQFVISYAADVLPSGPEHFLKSNNYTLHFWLFIPSKPLKKVWDVRLFGSELTLLDSDSDGLGIAVCQWPSISNKILIYGSNRDQWNQAYDEGVECFITVCSIPSLQPCSKCTQKTLQAQKKRLLENNFVTSSAKTIHCLKHNFAVHVQYHLLPPFPPFIPKICVGLDNIVVFNTGDTICALTVTVYETLINSSSSHQQQPTCDRTSKGEHLPFSGQGINVKNDNSDNNDFKTMKNGARSVGSEAKENIKPNSDVAREKAKLTDNCDSGVVYNKFPDLKLMDYNLIYVQHDDLEHAEVPANHGEEDIIYDNHLSLEVCGADNCRMKILPKSKIASWDKECISVKQQICQVESFVNAMAEQICGSPSTPVHPRNLIFVDYFTHILDVCPASQSIFFVVQLLFEAKDNYTKRLCLSWYKRSFCFQWTPTTNSCHIIHHSPLDQIDFKEKDRIRKSGVVCNLESLSCHSRHVQSLRPPSSYMQSVKVMTNEPVLRNESLKMICEPYHGVALVS